MRWVFLLLIWLLAEVGGYYGLRRLGLWRRWMGWITVSALAAFFLIWAVEALALRTLEAKLTFREVGGILFAVWLALTLAKLGSGLWGLVVVRRSKELPLLERRAFLQASAGLIAAAPAALIGYGYWVGRYRFRVLERVVPVKDLPAAFEGLRLVQLSDLHSGSFYHRPDRLEEVWALIQSLRPEILCFTGDWVNVYAGELAPFVEALAQLSAPLGKWAILGNHDYGDYAHWPSPLDKAADQKLLRTLIAQAGFQLLEDQAVPITLGRETIYLIGIGNWSYWQSRQQYGNLEKALAQVPSGACSLLLSHDPTHWEHQVVGRQPIALTLSGHTHGLQIGIEWGPHHWSPAGWLYTYWADLYRVGSQALYVNRGLGYIGLPARLGIWPEVTLLRLIPLQKAFSPTA